MVVPKELSTRIDQVMASLEALKLRAADAPGQANSQFASILETALDNSHDTAPVAAAEPIKVQAEAAPQIPSWVDPDYGYDPADPRKPNMRELKEALSGRSVEASTRTRIQTGRTPRAWQLNSSTASPAQMTTHEIGMPSWGRVTS